MRYLSISQIFELHDLIISSSGGSRGIRDINALESAVNLPCQTFDQQDLYPDIVTKAAALCFSLVMNQPGITCGIFVESCASLEGIGPADYPETLAIGTTI
jgi:death-on-curing protein